MLWRPTVASTPGCRSPGYCWLPVLTTPPRRNSPGSSTSTFSVRSTAPRQHCRRCGIGAAPSSPSRRWAPNARSRCKRAYCASKHGVDGFLEALRVELQHDAVPVSVTQIMPATINTPLFDNARTKIGVKPTAPPPGYPPASVAGAVVYAAEHPVRDIVVGGAAKALIVPQKIAPRLLDLLFRRFGYQLHNTGEPKAPTAPDNLDYPLPDRGHVEGSIGPITLSRSAYTWLQTHRPVSTAANTALHSLSQLTTLRRPPDQTPPA